MVLPKRSRRVIRDLRQRFPSRTLAGRLSAGDGPAEFIDLDEVVSAQLDEFFPGAGRGSLIVRGASSWGLLPPGTSGDVLTSNGPGADLSYAAAGGGGGGSGGYATKQPAFADETSSYACKGLIFRPFIDIKIPSVVFYWKATTSRSYIASLYELDSAGAIIDVKGESASFFSSGVNYVQPVFSIIGDTACSAQGLYAVCLRCTNGGNTYKLRLRNAEAGAAWFGAPFLPYPGLSTGVSGGIRIALQAPALGDTFLSSSSLNRWVNMQWTV